MDHNVLNVRSLGTRKATYDKRSRIAYDVIAPMLNEMSPPRAATGSPVSVAYVVRPRAGRAVITDEDHEWRYTLLWGCGISPCFTGDVVIVTPHGWRYDEQGGWEPRLADPSRPPLRAVG
jgi:hypothetical protein